MPAAPRPRPNAPPCVPETEDAATGFPVAASSIEEEEGRESVLCLLSYDKDTPAGLFLTSQVGVSR
jgi:hypothetical protein